MNKRFFLALLLSFLVLWTYSAIAPKPKTIANEEVVKKEASSAPVFSKTDAFSDKSCLIVDNTLNNKELYKFEKDDLILMFSLKGAYIHSIYDKNFNTCLDLKSIGLVSQWKDYDFTVSELPKGLEFSYKASDGTSIRKTFRSKDDGTWDIEIIISNVNSSSAACYDIITGAISSPKRDPVNERYFEGSYQVKNVVSRKGLLGLKNPLDIQDKIDWVGMRDRYFCAVFVPQFSVDRGTMAVDGKVPYMTLHVVNEVPKSQERIENFFKVYVGLEDEKKLVSIGMGAERIVNFGFFDIIAKAILTLLTLINRLFHNWGWSIIFITILIYILLFPLSIKSMMSMKKMQALQPKVEALKIKFKDNPQKLQMATMELYKEEKVNPLGGCVPMLLQIPVFFSLYQLLMRFPVLRGAHFLWIKDLSSPDRLVYFPKPIPVIGSEFNILPILMAVIMFFQQKLSMGGKALTPEAAEQQKIMVVVMPILFGFLFYRMPSGLVLYWLVNSTLMLIFQWKISLQK